MGMLFCPWDPPLPYRPSHHPQRVEWQWHPSKIQLDESQTENLQDEIRNLAQLFGQEGSHFYQQLQTLSSTVNSQAQGLKELQALRHSWEGMSPDARIQGLQKWVQHVEEVLRNLLEERESNFRFLSHTKSQIEQLYTTLQQVGTTTQGLHGMCQELYNYFGQAHERIKEVMKHM